MSTQTELNATKDYYGRPITGSTFIPAGFRQAVKEEYPGDNSFYVYPDGSVWTYATRRRDFMGQLNDSFWVMVAGPNPDLVVPITQNDPLPKIDIDPLHFTPLSIPYQYPPIICSLPASGEYVCGGYIPNVGPLLTSAMNPQTHYKVTDTLPPVQPVNLPPVQLVTPATH